MRRPFRQCLPTFRSFSRPWDLHESILCGVLDDRHASRMNFHFYFVLFLIHWSRRPRPQHEATFRSLQLRYRSTSPVAITKLYHNSHSKCEQLPHCNGSKADNSWSVLPTSDINQCRPVHGVVNTALPGIYYKSKPSETHYCT